MHRTTIHCQGICIRGWTVMETWADKLWLTVHIPLTSPKIYAGKEKKREVSQSARQRNEVRLYQQAKMKTKKELGRGESIQLKNTEKENEAMTQYGHVCSINTSLAYRVWESHYCKLWALESLRYSPSFPFTLLSFIFFLSFFCGAKQGCSFCWIRWLLFHMLTSCWLLFHCWPVGEKYPNKFELLWFRSIIFKNDCYWSSMSLWVKDELVRGGQKTQSSRDKNKFKGEQRILKISKNSLNYYFFLLLLITCPVQKF